MYNFKENDRAWQVADTIIEQCKDPRSVFFGLIVRFLSLLNGKLLEEMIQNKWSVVPMAQRESIKNYSLSKAMAVSEIVLCYK